MGLDRNAAASVTDQVFCSSIINRLFFEDYEQYFAESSLAVDFCMAINEKRVPEPELQSLMTKYPGKARFGAYGMFIKGRRQ